MCTHLNGLKYRKWLDISMWWYPNRLYHFVKEWIWEYWQWRGTQHFSKLQNWSLIIRRFSVISRTLVVERGILGLFRDWIGVFYSSCRLVESLRVGLRKSKWSYSIFRVCFIHSDDKVPSTNISIISKYLVFHAAWLVEKKGFCII